MTPREWRQPRHVLTEFADSRKQVRKNDRKGKVEPAIHVHQQAAASSKMADLLQMLQQRRWSIFYLTD